MEGSRLLKKGGESMRTVTLIFGNDKNLVIFAVLVIVVYSVYMLGIDAKEIASNALSGLFGIAVGQKISQEPVVNP
jgi:hypothetical protein